MSESIANLQPSSEDPTPAHSPASDNVRPSRWGVLRHTHFRTVWFAAAFSYLGGWFEFVGTQWIVTEKTGSMLWSSYLGSAQLFPTLFLGLLGGIVADSVNRKKLIVYTQLAMMLIALGFALVVWINPSTNALLAWLLALALAQGVTIAFNNPAWQVLTPRLVPRDELFSAITLSNISFNAARAVGPALAGLILAAWSPIVLFVLNAFSFIGVMAAVLSTPDAPPPPDRMGWHRDLARMWRDTKDAFAFIFHQPGPRAAFLANVVFATFATPVMRFLSLFVTNVYHLQERTFGFMTAAMGAGAVIGGLLLKKVPSWYPRHHLIPLSILLGGLFIFLFSISRDPWVAAAFMLFVGWFWMWAFGSAMGALQLLIPDHMRGRVMSVCNCVSLGLMPLGYFLASAIGKAGANLTRSFAPHLWDDGLDTQLGVGLGALICVAAGLIMLTWRTPEVDAIMPGDPAYDRTPGLWRGISASFHRPRHTHACPRCLAQLPLPPEGALANACPQCGQNLPHPSSN
jgi:predicted MFS family arabinose efflux permease